MVSQFEEVLEEELPDLEEKDIMACLKYASLKLNYPVLRVALMEKMAPCHTDDERKRFWTDVCKSLSLSVETIIAEAKRNNELLKKHNSLYLPDLRIRIEKILNK